MRSRFDQVKSILFIHHMLAMGEVVLLTGVYETIIKNIPNIQLSIIASKYACQFLQTLPYFKLIMPIEQLGLYTSKSKLFILRKITSFFLKNRYDWIIWRDDKKLPYNLVLKAGVIFNRPKRNINFAPLLKKHLNSNLHICKIYTRVLKEIGFYIEDIVVPHLEVKEGDAFWAEHFLMQRDIDKKKGYKIIGICPISNLKIKNWPMEKVSLLIEELLSINKNIKILLFSSQNFLIDQDIIRIGILPFNKLIALIKACDIFISVDTGPMHVASALGVPTIALFGPTSGKMFGPISKGSKIIQKEIDCPYYNPYASLFPFGVQNSCYQYDRCLWQETSCINLITVKDVLNALKELI